MRALARSGESAAVEVSALVVPLQFRVHRIADRLGADQCAEIIRRYQAGASATSLAKEYQVAPSALIRLLRERCITVRPATLVNNTLANTIAEEYQAGATLAILQQRHGISRSTIQRTLDRLGIEKRKTGRPPRAN